MDEIALVDGAASRALPHVYPPPTASPITDFDRHCDGLVLLACAQAGGILSLSGNATHPRDERWRAVSKTYIDAATGVNFAGVWSSSGTGRGWAVGNKNTIVRTSRCADAQARWVGVQDGVADETHYNAIDGATTHASISVAAGSNVRTTKHVDHVWVVGSGGVVLHFNTSHWIQQASGTTVALRGVTVLSPTLAFACGDGGVVLRFDGSEWSAVKTGAKPTTTFQAGA